MKRLPVRKTLADVRDEDYLVLEVPSDQGEIFLRLTQVKFADHDIRSIIIKDRDVLYRYRTSDGLAHDDGQRALNPTLRLRVLTAHERRQLTAYLTILEQFTMIRDTARFSPFACDLVQMQQAALILQDFTRKLDVGK